MFRKMKEQLPSVGQRRIKRVIVFVVGMTVLLIGVVMIVLPGPAIIVIPAGLAILGIEFAWARRWLLKARGMLDKVTKSKKSKPPPQ